MERNLERLIPMAGSVVNEGSVLPLASSSHHSSGKEAFSKVIRCWASKKFVQDGLGFMTSISFIFLVGVFMSSWLGASVLSLGEWLIKRMPLISYIYSASKQISAAISQDQKSKVFKEVAIIRHPRIGEYAIDFITSTPALHGSSSEEELCCVFVASNHLYIGDIILISSKDILQWKHKPCMRQDLESMLGHISNHLVVYLMELSDWFAPQKKC